MSNYAPNPKKQSVYEGLAQQKLSDVTAADIELFTKPTFIQAENQDALLTYNIINQAAMRSGTPMQNGMKIVQSATSDSDRIWFRPEIGECYQFVGGDMLSSGGTASINYELRDDAGTVCLFAQGSVNGQEVIGRDQPYIIQPIIVTHDVYLFINMTAGSARVTGAFVRLR